MQTAIGKRTRTPSEGQANTPKTFSGNWIPEVDLNGLTEKQKLVAQQMLLEESDCFSRDDEDIGCSDELKMKINLINLTDNIPVQKNYNLIPKPLYPVVKQYIEDLLIRKFIRKSKSAYSSPVVCVRKKDGTLRLCVDYRELNRRTIADRHPLPKVQTTSRISEETRGFPF
jgi:hypothetical protein